MVVIIGGHVYWWTCILVDMVLVDMYIGGHGIGGHVYWWTWYIGGHGIGGHGINMHNHYPGGHGIGGHVSW